MLPILFALMAGTISEQVIVPTKSRVKQESLAEKVAERYVEIAHLRYRDSWQSSRDLLKAINAFLKNPNQETHLNAKKLWAHAHAIYSLTEVYRFGNPNVDAWESKVNAWPLDEGLIDYVADDYVFHEGNAYAKANLIGKSRVPLTDDLLAKFQSGSDKKEAPSTSFSDVETNVTIGFHAIEFLLWGQDRNQKPTDSGLRSHTDFMLGERGTNGNMKRRRAYLSAISRQLLQDLRFMIIDWKPDGRQYSKTFRNLPVKERLNRMIVGLGSLSFAELASERLRVALLAHDQEEEQSCFSDLTHHAIYQNVLAIQQTYLGIYVDLNGKSTEGPALSDLVQKVDPELDKVLRKRLDKTLGIANELKKVGDAGEAFDQMILANNKTGRSRILALINALKSQTESFENLRNILDQLANQ